MAYIFRLPEMGEGLTEGDVASWLVKEGEAIKADDPLIEIQTDKSTTQLVSPVDGTVKKLFVKEDDHVEKGDKLAEIDDGKPGISTNVESEDDDDETDTGSEEATESEESTAPVADSPSEDNSSITGASILQGIHHSAQKSTKTGTSDFNTSSEKFFSFNCIAIIHFSFLFFNDVFFSDNPLPWFRPGLLRRLLLQSGAYRRYSPLRQRNRVKQCLCLLQS